MTGPNKKNREAYERHKAAAAKWARKTASAGRDIGKIPPVKDPQRRIEATRDHEVFENEYFPELFNLPSSEDHRQAGRKLDRAITKGGRFALGMPRGFGKTTKTEVASIRATLCAFRRFCVLIGAEQDHGNELLQSIKTQLMENDRLYEDFPEIIHPIRALDGIFQRQTGQLYGGQLTHLKLTQNKIVLPSIPGSPASGSVIRALGMTGRIRGLGHTTPDGKKIRPDLAICDDPQTDESARSPKQTADRLKTINGAVLGLAGPNSKIACVVPCTVIEPNDLADQLLNPKTSPEWHGERSQLVYSFPTNTKRWDEYNRLRLAALADGDDDAKPATEYYRKHQAAMDKGARVAWPENFRPGEISAIQYAQNLRLEDEASFWAERQNQPQTAGDDSAKLAADEIAARVNGRPAGRVPSNTHTLAAYIDIQQRCLFYLVAAWSEDFGGAVVDYGTWPDQRRDYFSLRDARRTLALKYPRAGGVEGAVQAGLADLVAHLLQLRWTRDDQAAQTLDAVWIDSGWLTETITDFVRAQNSPVIRATKGLPIRAANKPFSEYNQKPGDRAGHHWRIPAPRGRDVPVVQIDTNHWKTFIAGRLSVDDKQPGALTLYGDDPRAHRMLSDHLAAEYPVKVSARGRTIDEWLLAPNRPDNHWWDCLVGSAVAASFHGCKLPGQAEPHRRRKVKSFAAKRRGRRT